MKIFNLALVILLGLSGLIALCSPFLLLRAAKHNAGDAVRARRYLACSGIVIAITVGSLLGLSFSGRAGNVVAVVIALYCGVALALYSFRLRPKLLAVPVGVMSMIGWLMLTLFLCIDTLFSGNSTVAIELGDGLHCRESVYGFVTSDSGEEMDVFKRYVFIDHKLYHEARSAIYPIHPTYRPAALQDAIRRCEAAVRLKRTHVTS